MNTMSQPPQYLLLITAEAAADSLSSILAMDGYHVLHTSDIDTGMVMLHQYQPALVVLDVNLRRLDALALCQQIRAAHNVNPPVIIGIITARQVDQIDRYLAAGMADCVVLPVHPRLMRQRVQLLLKLRNYTTEQLRTQQSLEESEHFYRDLFNSANDAILIVDLATGQFLDVNRLAARWLGYTHEELLAENFAAIDVPINSQQRDYIREELSTTGRMIYEQYYRAKDGRLIPVEVSSRLIRYGGKRAFLSFARDVTRRHEMEQAERQQRILAETLSTSAAILNRLLDFDQIIKTMLDLLKEVISSDTANFLKLEGDQVVFAGSRGYEQMGIEVIGRRAALSQLPIARWMQVYQRPFIVADTRQEPMWSPLPDPKVINVVLSYVGAPVMVGDEVLGFMGLNSFKPDHFTTHDAEVLMAFANQAGIALHNALLFEKVQRHAEDLEQRVQQRTAELSEANRVLQEQIDERKKIETALAAERNLLRTLVDSLPDDVYVKDRQGRYMLVNESFRNQLNKRQANQRITGSTVFDHFNYELARQTYEEDNRIFETGMLVMNREEIVIEEGEQRWKLTSKLPLYNQEAEIIGIIGVVRDITALRGAEEQLSYVVTGANCLLWYAGVSYDVECKTFEWDFHVSSEPAARRFLPLPELPNTGYAEAWQQSIVPEDIHRIRQNAQVALLNNYSAYNHEYRCQRMDGQIRWLYEEVRIRPLSPTRWSLVGVATDITERKQNAQTLQTAYEQLEQRVQERTIELSRANNVLQEQIAERRRAEVALRESEARFRALVEHAPEAIVVFDVVTERFIDVNDNAVQLFGLPREQLLRRGPMDFNPPRQPEGQASTELMRQKIRSAVGGDLPVFEWMYLNAHHETIPCEVRLLLLPTAGSLMVRGSITDISERLRIRQAEQEQRMLAEALADAAADLNRTLALDDVLDRMLEHITRVMPPHESASIMLIDDDDELVHVLRYRNENADYQELPRSPMPFRNVPNWLAMYETQQPITLSDTRNATNWRRYFPSANAIQSYTAAPIIVEGRVIGFINLGSTIPNVFHEGHAHRLQSFANQVGIAIQNARLYEEIRVYALRLEQRVAERTAELDTERTRLRAILDAMTEGVIYYEEARGLVYTNRSLMRLLGYAEEDFFERDLTLEMVIGSQDQIEAWVDSVNEGLLMHGIWRGIMKMHRKDGAEFDGSIVTTAVNNNDDELIGWVMVLRDVSLEQRLEQQKKRFIAVASHELRTPITNLKTRLYLIHRQPEKLDQHLQVMETVTERMRKLVEDLFDVSRFEHGVIPLKRSTYDLCDLVYKVASLQQPEAQHKAIQLQAILPSSPVFAEVDFERFNQVITNLVANAIHYTPPEGIVSVELTASQRVALISVRDTGPGIPEEWFEQIFKPFFKGSENSTGAGLGLSIAREIVELHGGKLVVDSTVGVGTCFTIWLPLPAAQLQPESETPLLSAKPQALQLDS